jgi:hypothetical protein
LEGYNFCCGEIFDTIERFSKQERKKERKKMLQEEGDDDDSAARMMLWETNNRRAAALPPLGRVLATIFAAECREVEKNLASDSARTKQGKTLNLFFFSQFFI